MKLAFLFAGQGSQHVGMGKDFYETYPEFREVFDLLPDNLRKIAFEGPEDELKQTVNTQAIMLAFALGIYKILESKGIKPCMAAGLSLGEYSALAASGVWDISTAIKLISYRADQMEKASEGVNCVMSAVLGLERNKLRSIVSEASKSGMVEIANYNCPGQIVISGEEAGVLKAEELAKKVGAKRCMRLAVSGPFHTSYMIPAGKALEEKFKEIPFLDMAFPVLFNYTGNTLAEGEDVKELLVKQVSGSVHFEDIIRNMIASGVDTIVEIGPGKALTGFVKKTDRSIKAVNIDAVADIDKVISLCGEV